MTHLHAAYDYLPESEVIEAISSRPREQSVVVTGRGGGKRLHEIMDTVSEVKEVRHAFRDGVKARKVLTTKDGSLILKMQSPYSIAPNFYLAYKVLNSLFLGLSLGTVFKIYTPS